MCFRCTISMCETYELWINEFCMIYITKLWNVKFVMQIGDAIVYYVFNVKWALKF
jgi:hypothetical protein